MIGAEISLWFTERLSVTSVALAPQDDVFLSASDDYSVKLWDLRTRTQQGELKTPDTSRVTFDNTGAVFAVMHNFKSTVALYDTRNFDAPPFLSVQLNDPILPQRSAPMRTPYYTSCVFSRDGKWMLVGTSGATHYVLDAFECQIVARLEGHVGYDLPGPRSGPAQPYNSGCEVCWSPDSRFVLSGAHDCVSVHWSPRDTADLPPFAQAPRMDRSTCGMCTRRIWARPEVRT